MTPGRVLRIAVLGTALLVAGCQQELVGGIPETEANEMLAVLLSSNIDATKTPAAEGTFNITVAKDDVLHSLEVLRERGLPRTIKTSIGTVFAGGGIVSSPFEERVRYIYALGEEVAQTLQQIDGVLAARVHIVMPQAPSIGQAVQPSSAAVFIKQRNGVDLDYLVPQIRRLVSNAIEGVSYDQVSVTLVEARPSELTAPTPSDEPTQELLPGILVAEESTGAFWRAAAIAGGVLLLSLIGNVVLAVMSYRARKSSRSQALARHEQPA